MAQTSFPFENVDTTEVQFSQWARHINQGIRPDFADELEPFADDSGLNVKVKAGQAMVRGHYYASTAEETLTITTPDETNPRIDSVVLELDIVANAILLKVIEGTPDASPVAPTLTQSEDGNVYQFLLANVDVAAGTFSIEDADVTDLRTYMFQGVGKWTTDTRPENPIDNQTIGYNTDLNTHEVWNGTAWTSVFAPITTEGDLAIGDSTGTAVRLPIGPADTVLTSNGTTATWEDAGGGGAIAYEAEAGGTYTVSIDAGVYAVASEAAYPITIDGQEINEDTIILKLDSEATSLEFLIKGADLDDFTEQTVPDFTSTLQSATYGDGLYVVVGADAYVATSPDGVTWTERTVPNFTGTLRGTSYGNGLYVVVGEISGYVATSPDGITWTERTVPDFTSTLYATTYADGLYVVVGSDGYVATSPDGVTWTERTVPNFTSTLRGTTYGDGLYVVVGADAYVATSPDGITWTERTVPDFTSSLLSATYGNGLYVVVGSEGYVATSPDGITWTERTVPDFTSTLFGATYGNGLYVVVGFQGYVATSPDGITWTEKTVPDFPSSLYATTYGDGLCVVVGNDGYVATAEGVEETQYLILTAAEIETLS